MRINAELGLRIKRVRIERGMSQAELATMLGYTDRSSIAKIEAGKTDMSQEKINETARILGTTAAFLEGSLEDTLRTMNVSVIHHVNGRIQVMDTVRGVHADYSPDIWRRLEELDDFRTVWNDLDEKVSAAIEKGHRDFTELFVKDEFKNIRFKDHVDAEIVGKTIPTGTGLHVYTKEKLAPVTEDKPSEIQIIFDQLSPANQSKLMELGRLYLNDQHNTEEKQ